MYRLEAIDFGRRMAVEKEIEKTETAPQPNAVFDESSNFLIYSSLLGIKVKTPQAKHIHILKFVFGSDFHLRGIIVTLSVVMISLSLPSIL